MRLPGKGMGRERRCRWRWLTEKKLRVWETSVVESGEFREKGKAYGGI